MSRQVAKQARAAIGRFTNITARQDAASVSAPPISGPAALPNPATPMIRPPASPALSSGSSS